MNKKGSPALIVIIIFLAAIVLIFLIVNISDRDCSKDSECPENSYCGSDYQCHQFPDRIVVKESSGLLGPSIVVAVALIIAALIVRLRNTPRKKEE
tara:strand:+ start:1165 stop:1452 length:288 start_codon:yes stop_codon:yes gene_type:complete